MVFNKGVIVSVNRCDGQLYKGYAPTQSEADIATGAKLVYLEAVRSETFYVTVELQRYFDFKSSPVVEIACSIGERQAFGYVQAEDVKRAETAPGQAKPKYCQARTRRFMNGMWMERGEDVATILLAVEDKHSNGTRGIDTPGCLCVRVTRGYTEGPDSRLADVDLSSSQASTSSVELSGRYHAPRLGRYLPLQDRNFPTHDPCFRAASEDVSESIVVIFEYRSRVILEQLGITPERLKPWTANRSTATSGKSSLKLTLKDSQTFRRSSVDSRGGFKLKLGDPHTSKRLPVDSNGDLPTKKVKRAAADARTAEYDDESPRTGIILKLKKSKGAENAVTNISTAAPADRKDTTKEVEHGTAPAISVEDDELKITDVRPVPVAQMAASSGLSASVAQGMSEHDLERRKKLLEMRLEETRLKREEKKLERQLFELGN